MEHREYCYWLLSMQTVGSAAIARMLYEYGSPESIWQKGPLPDLSERQQAEFFRSKSNIGSLRRQYEKLQRDGVRMILAEDEDYPRRLRNIHNKPYGFFVKGELPDEGLTHVAIVGARRATPHGLLLAEELAGELARFGIVIVSGMAEGIDGRSHTGALSAGGRTVAVLGCAIDECFPAVNRKLYDSIPVSGGAVISEYAPGMPGLPANFPMRNRIISGLSDLVLVVEARERSGSLITADRALEQGRDVMAVPGRPDDRQSEGCNRLIKQGAGLCTCAKDVLEQLELLPPVKHHRRGDKKKKDADEMTAQQNLTEAELKTWKVIGAEPVHIDSIAAQTGLSIREQLGILMKLELMGYIRSVTTGLYQRNSLL